MMITLPPTLVIGDLRDKTPKCNTRFGRNVVI